MKKLMLALSFLLSFPAHALLSPISSGGGAVSTVFGRAGAVTAQSGDYASFYLLNSSNLSDLGSASTARTNLGLGSAATQNSSAFQAAGNYLTGTSGDVTSTGPGTVAATVALVGGSTAASVHQSQLDTAAATDANTASTIVKRDGAGAFSASGITLGNSNNTRKMVFDYSAPNVFFIGKAGSNYSIAISDTSAGNTGSGWVSIGPNGPSSLIPWPLEFHTNSADGGVTSLSSFLPLDGAVVNSLPIVVARNASPTVNTLECYGTTGSSSNLMGGLCSRHVVQTGGSEQSDVFLFNQNAGTVEEKLRISSTGQVSVHGNAPSFGAGCGAGATLSTGSNDVAGTITMGAVPGTNCALNFAATWGAVPQCFANDRTAIISTNAVPTTTTVTFGATVAFAASTVLDYHCLSTF